MKQTNPIVLPGMKASKALRKLQPTLCNLLPEHRCE